MIFISREVLIAATRVVMLVKNPSLDATNSEQDDTCHFGAIESNQESL